MHAVTAQRSKSLRGARASFAVYHHETWQQLAANANLM